MHRTPCHAISGLVALALAAWAGPGAAKATLTGTAAYRERVALTAGAVLEVELQDVSRADAPAQSIAKFRKQNPGQVPISFTITYDPKSIVAGHQYVVRATIVENGRLRFTTDEAYPVLTNGHGTHVGIMMRGVSGAGSSQEHQGTGASLGNLPATFAGALPCADCAGIRTQIDFMPGGGYLQRMTYLRNGHDDSVYEVGAWRLSKDAHTLTLDGGREDTHWSVRDSRTLRKLDAHGKPIDSKLPYELTRSSGLAPVEARAKLMGEFRYRADAARFRDCLSNLEWPVTTSGDYRALEHAYLEKRSAPGADLLVSLQGRIERRPKMEGVGTEPTLVVEKFLRVESGEKCPGSPVEPGLANNRWRPVSIGGKTVLVTEHQSEPWIYMDLRSRRVTGSGGCNRIGGSYEGGAGKLRFVRLVSSQMACPSLETETAFFRALDNTRGYRISGRTLELLDEHGSPLARLEERNL